MCFHICIKGVWGLLSQVNVKTAFSLKSKWSSTRAAGRAIWNRSSPAIRTPKGPASQMSLQEPIRGPRPLPPLDSHISPRTARFIYYVQPLTPLASWRRVFQFLISLLPRRRHSKQPRIDTQACNSSRRRPTRSYNEFFLRMRGAHSTPQIVKDVLVI